jgi:hypothetical protein
MSVMGSIFTKVFDQETLEGCGAQTALAARDNQRSAAMGPLTFPQPIDIDAILRRIAAKRGDVLNWRQSIVDLMKLLGLDSSLAARRELADELGYAGSIDDTATMNMWLHREVMRKLAASSPKLLNALGGEA